MPGIRIHPVMIAYKSHSPLQRESPVKKISNINSRFLNTHGFTRNRKSAAIPPRDSSFFPGSNSVLNTTILPCECSTSFKNSSILLYVLPPFRSLILPLSCRLLLFEAPPGIRICRSKLYLQEPLFLQGQVLFFL